MSIDSAPTPVGLVRKLCLRFFLRPGKGLVQLLGFTLPFGFALPGLVLAQNQGAHVHGVADLAVVYEDGTLMVELQTPAANLLGFEQAPTNARESRALSEAMAILNTPNRVIKLEPPCKLQDQKVLSPFPDTQLGQDGATRAVAHAARDEDHAHHDLEDQHEDDHHQSQGNHEQHDHDHSGETHQDFHIVYQWHCSAKGPIGITLRLFEWFPGFEKVKVQWLAFGRQSAEVLDKEHTKVEIVP